MCTSPLKLLQFYKERERGERGGYRGGKKERERDVCGNDSKPIRWQIPKKINVWVGLADDV